MSTENPVRDANLAVVANIAEMVTRVITEVAGNDIANTIDGKTITHSFVAETAALKVGSLAEGGHMGVRHAQ